MKTTKVLIIDDSSLVRQALQSIFDSTNDIEVIANAADPYFAVQKIKQQKPDVITLDIQMPRMDGITFLKKLMKQHPIPVVIISSLTKKDNHLAMKAYEYGAIKVIEKPQLGTREAYAASREQLLEAVRAASKARLSLPTPGLLKESRLKLPHQAQHTVSDVHKIPSRKLILMGASVGGTEAIAGILHQLKNNLPGIVLVQHMPVQFTSSFADRLNNISKIQVKEASDGDIIADGHAYLAPGDRHILLERDMGNMVIRTSDGPAVNRHKPSVDVLFSSAAEIVADRTKAVLLTGMGKDGAQGLLKLKQQGALTLAQNEESCVVFGMPKEAIKIDAAVRIMDPQQIINELNT